MTNEEKYKTAEERQEAFCAFCRPKMCYKCPCYAQINGKSLNCILRWLALEAKEEKELIPCPFCGGVAMPDRWWISGLSYVQCVDCGSMTKNCDTKEEAIAAWNRRAK